MKRGWVGVVVIVIAGGGERAAHAQDGAPPSDARVKRGNETIEESGSEIQENGKETRAEPRVGPNEKLPGYVQLFATTFFGEGFRFNNPYRLATPLGSDAESVSLTAPYVDVGLGATFGGANWFSHGIAFRMSFATSGVKQAVLTPSYLVYRRWSRVAAYARAGVPIVATPDATWGGELGLGGVVYVRGGIGLAAEIVGDVFYGAGTRDVAVATYPILSGQLGVVIAYEVLP